MTKLELISKTHKKLHIPTICPLCNHKLAINDTHSRIYCPNLACKSYTHARILKYLQTMGVMHIASATIDDLLEKGFIKDVPDLYNINWKKVAKLDGYGEVSTNKYKKEINDHTICTLAEFLTAFNIHDLGYKTIYKMIGNKSLEEVLDAKYTDFMTVVNSTYINEDGEEETECEYINGIGEITAKKFAKGLKQLRKLILETSKYIEIYEEEKPEGTILEGLSFCFTGKSDSGYGRTELENMVVQNGGVVRGVSKNLSFLVTDDQDSGSSKNEKAKKYGTKVITSEQFLKMIGQ